MMMMSHISGEYATTSKILTSFKKPDIRLRYNRGVRRCISFFLAYRLMHGFTFKFMIRTTRNTEVDTMTSTRTSSSNMFDVVLPVLSKKIIAIQLLSLVCLTNLVGCICSNVVNTLVWRFFTRHWIIFWIFLWIISQFHHGKLVPPMKINLCHWQFVLMSLNIHFSSDHYWLEFPPIGCTSLAVDLVLQWGSAELGIQPLLIIITLRQ